MTVSRRCVVGAALDDRPRERLVVEACVEDDCETVAVDLRPAPVPEDQR